MKMKSLILGDEEDTVEEDVPDMGQWPSVLGKYDWCGEYARFNAEVSGAGTASAGLPG